MLDIKFIRENVELVKQGAAAKHVACDVDRLIEVDRRRELQVNLDKLREQVKESGQPCVRCASPIVRVGRLRRSVTYDKVCISLGWISQKGNGSRSGVERAEGLESDGAAQAFGYGAEQRSVEPVDRAAVVFARPFESLVILLQTLDEQVHDLQRAVRMQDGQKLSEPV